MTGMFVMAMVFLIIWHWYRRHLRAEAEYIQDGLERIRSEERRRQEENNNNNNNNSSTVTDEENNIALKQPPAAVPVIVVLPNGDVAFAREVPSSREENKDSLEESDSSSRDDDLRPFAAAPECERASSIDGSCQCGMCHV